MSSSLNGEAEVSRIEIALLFPVHINLTHRIDWGDGNQYNADNIDKIWYLIHRANRVWHMKLYFSNNLGKTVFTPFDVGSILLRVHLHWSHPLCNVIELNVHFYWLFLLHQINRWQQQKEFKACERDVKLQFFFSFTLSLPLSFSVCLRLIYTTALRLCVLEIT